MKKICVLTSGGDSSGMNEYIKMLAKLSKKNGDQLFGSMYGYDGLIKQNFVPLDYDYLQNIESMGGSIIKSSRSKDFMTSEGFSLAVKNIKSNFDCVVVVGGNGSYKGAIDLMNAGINVIAIPGTIDNDLYYTDKTLGFDTACQNALDATIKIRQSLQSFDRGCIVEVMGRHCPDIAEHTAILSNADMLITEKLDFEKILTDVKATISSGVSSPLIIVQENLIDVNALAKYLEQTLQKEFRASVLGYIQRGGEPTANDKLFAIQLAVASQKKIAESLFGYALGKKDEVMIATRLCDLTFEPSANNTYMRQLFEKISG